MSEQKYYIHDEARGRVGNSMVWLHQDPYGHTCDLRKARIFDEDELLEYLKSGYLVAYPIEAVQKGIEHHVAKVASVRWITGKPPYKRLVRMERLEISPTTDKEE